MSALQDETAVRLRGCYYDPVRGLGVFGTLKPVLTDDETDTPDASIGLRYSTPRLSAGIAMNPFADSCKQIWLVSACLPARVQRGDQGSSSAPTCGAHACVHALPGCWMPCAVSAGEFWCGHRKAMRAVCDWRGTPYIHLADACVSSHHSETSGFDSVVSSATRLVFCCEGGARWASDSRAAAERGRVLGHAPERGA